MVKKSFTLFEVLISLVLLSLVISITLKLFNSNDNVEIYYQLQDIENRYNENGVINQNEKIKFN